MVGMSGKASEPRRGQSSQQKKAAAGSVGTGGGSNKTQPPPEALHVANILGDSIYPDDLPHRMAQVMAMLPSCQEEEVCVALHDHDFDPEKAISALLDSDPRTRGQGEWTTKKGRRSKGGDGGTDFIIAPGDGRLSGKQGGGGRGTNKAASQNVRENYGGSVSVGGEGGRGRGGGEGGRGRSGGERGRGAKGRAGSSGRGRSTSNRRDREEKEGKREEKPRGERGEKAERGEKGERGERGERGEKGERGGRQRNRGSRGPRARARAAAAESERAGEERGAEEKSLSLPVASESWDDDPQPSTEWDDHHTTGSPSHRSLDPSSSSAAADQTWDSEAESKSSQPLFPEAFTDPTTSDPVTSETAGLPLPGLPTASSAQPTALTATTPGSLPHQTTPGSLPHQTTPGSLPHQTTPGSLPHRVPLGCIPRRPSPGSLSNRTTAPVEFQTAASVSGTHSSRLHSRHKRLARSQIPSQPVEMPKGSFPEMSELGIAFGGIELLPSSSATSASREPTSGSPSSSSSSQPQDGLLATPTTNEAMFQSDPVTTATLTFSTQFAEDSGVISIATTTAGSYGGSGKKLEAPPGLPHPLANPHTSTVATLTPSGSLPHSVVPSGSLPHSVVPSGSLPHSVVPSGSLPHSVVPSGSLPHSVVPSGSLPHSVVPSGSLPHAVVSSGGLTASGSLVHTVPLTTSQDSVVSTSGPLPSTSTVNKAGGGVGAMLAPEPISLPPPPPPASSLLTPIESAAAADHSKTTFTTAATTSQLLPQSFPSTAITSSAGTSVGGASELLPSQATPTSSSMATPTSKTLTAQSSHHHGNHQQLQSGLQGGSKHSSLQQQQQAMIYPYMLQPPLVMPMSAYYDPEMSRYQAASAVSMAYYQQHPTTSDPAMATGMGRDHGGSGFAAEGTVGGGGGGKFGGRGADISTSAAPPHSQQQAGVQQSQLGHAAVFNPYYGGNVIYPMYHGYGMPGFSHSIPKPSGGSSYPGGGVNSYQAPSGAGFGYEDVSTGAEYKMYGGMGGGALGKPHPMSSTAADLPTASGYKGHGGFDSKSSYSTYSMPQGGYSFIPTGPMPLQMPPSYMPGHEGGGGAGGRGQKHSNKQYSGSHGSSQLWSQQPSH